MSLLLGIFTFLLVLISLFMVLVILAQRAKSDGGVGAALGGGMTEAAFGAESGNVLSRATTIAAVAFFVISFGLYLGHIHQHRVALRENPVGMPDAPALTAPVEAPAALPPADATATPAADSPTAGQPAAETPAPAPSTPANP